MTAKQKSTRRRIREKVEDGLEAIKGKKTNISSPGYRLVQTLADRIDGQTTQDQIDLKDAKSIRSGVSRETEVGLVLSSALAVVRENQARAGN